jgi:large subunit ribosomal protein L23
MSFWNKFKKIASHAGTPKPEVLSEKKVSERKTIEKPVEKKEVAVTVKSEKTLKKNTGDAYRVLLHPIISEKSARIGEYRQYAFLVARKTNTIEVKRAVEKIYSVHVEHVNSLNVHGKIVRFGRRIGKRSPWKKAIVTLKPGERIDVYEGV